MFRILTNRHNRDLDDVAWFEMRWDEESFYNARVAQPAATFAGPNGPLTPGSWTP